MDTLRLCLLQVTRDTQTRSHDRRPSGWEAWGLVGLRGGSGGLGFNPNEESSAKKEKGEENRRARNQKPKRYNEEEYDLNFEDTAEIIADIVGDGRGDSDESWCPDKTSDESPEVSKKTRCRRPDSLEDNMQLAKKVKIADDVEEGLVLKQVHINESIELLVDVVVPGEGQSEGRDGEVEMHIEDTEIERVNGETNSIIDREQDEELVAEEGLDLKQVHINETVDMLASEVAEGEREELNAKGTGEGQSEGRDGEVEVEPVDGETNSVVEREHEELGNDGEHANALEEKDKIIRELREQLAKFERERGTIESLSTEIRASKGTEEKVGELDTISDEEKSVEEKLNCEHCSAEYKNFSSLVRHVRKKHGIQEAVKKAGVFKCDICLKDFKEKQVLRAHVKNVHNKVRCSACGKEQSNLKRHLQVCKVKKTAEKWETEKEKQNEEGTEMETEMLKQVSIDVTALGDAVGLGDQHDEIAEASAKSLQENPQCVSAGEVKEVGVSFTKGVIGIDCRAAGRDIKRDGNCSMRAAALSLYPNLSEEELEQKAYEIRVKSVGGAMEAMDLMGQEEIAYLQSVAAQDTEVIYSLSEMKEMLAIYLESGQWNGALGDILPQVIACSILRPIFIVEIQQGRAVSANIMKPGRMFNMGEAPEDVVPLLFFRQYNHFEVGHVTNEAQGAAIYKEFLRQGAIAIGPTGISTAKMVAGGKEAVNGDRKLNTRMTPRRMRRLFNPGTSSIPKEFSDSEEELLEEEKTDQVEESESQLATGSSTCKPSRQRKRDESPPPDGEGGGDKGTRQSTEGASVDNGGERSKAGNDKARERFDQSVLKTLQPREQENFHALRQQLDVGMKELPQLKEKLQQARRGDDKLAALVGNFKSSKDGRRWVDDNQLEKHGERSNRTGDLWENQLRSKIFPFLHSKYLDIDLGILIDFQEEQDHIDYARKGPSMTKKLHMFTEVDMVESVSNSFKSLPNPGPSKVQLIMAWMALCRAIAWHARNQKTVFADRSDAQYVMNHYTEIADSMADGIKYYKGLAAGKKAEDHMVGKTRPQGAALSKAVSDWFRSREREDLQRKLEHYSESEEPVSPHLFSKLLEMVHTDLVMSTPFRNAVWRNLPFRALAEAFANPGFDPADISGRQPEDIVTVTEDGLEVTYTTDVTRPPPSRACEHQKENPHCKCENACPPTGYNVLLTWDKGSCGKNRYLHLPLRLYDELSKFTSIRQRYLDAFVKNGPSGAEKEGWYKGHTPVLLNSAGKATPSFVMTLASKIAGIKVSPHMFRSFYCTYLARNMEKRVRDAQAKVCGHSSSVFEEFYDLGTRHDAQLLTQITQNLHQGEEVITQSETQARASQERLNDELQRVRDINEKIQKAPEEVDNHSLRNPILKEHLIDLVRIGCRLKVSFVTSHGNFSAAKRDSVGDVKLSKEQWMKEVAVMASTDSPLGQEMRQVLLEIFNGRDEVTKHKWSVRESIEERQSRAKGRGGTIDPHLSDPLYTLLSTIHVAINSRLNQAAGKKSIENDFDRCTCQDLPAAFNCVECQTPVCNRCCRCVDFYFLARPIVI